MNRRGLILLLLSTSLICGIVLITLIVIVYTEDRGIRTAKKELYQEVEELEKRLRHLPAYSNLLHYMSKEPGREGFVKKKDQRRLEDYRGKINALYGKELALYGQTLENRDLLKGRPDWVKDFMIDIYGLYLAALREITPLTFSSPAKALGLFQKIYLEEGRPGLFLLQGIGVQEILAQAEGQDIQSRLTQGIAKFSLPYTAHFDYQGKGDSEIVKDWIRKDRVLNKKLEKLDEAWLEIIYKLYNINLHPVWQYAVSLDAEIRLAWEELTLLFFGADLFRRYQDLLFEVERPYYFGQNYSISDIGTLRRIPDLVYYKNIPELMGQTSEETVTYFSSKLHLGYKRGDKKTQTFLNRNKDFLSDQFRGFFSRRINADFNANPGDNFPLSPGLRLLFLKAMEIHEVNKKILLLHPFGKNKVSGLRDIAFVKVSLLEY